MGELGPKVPFCPMVGSEVFSSEVKKTEVLMENFRRAIGLRIKETKEVYEGEVVELTPEETENPLGGYGKTVSHVVIGLKTTKGTKQLKLDPSIYEALQKEKVTPGDVIYIEANSGAVKRVGRSDAFATEFDLEAEEYVPLPKGDVHKRNRGMCTVRGTEVIAPHGVPVDLLDRLMIIRTMPYSLQEIVQILSIRAQVEGINVDEEAYALLGEIGVRSTLRYAVQLLTPAKVVVQTNGRDDIGKDDIEEIDSLFYDAKSSAKLLAEQKAGYLQ